MTSAVHYDNADSILVPPDEEPFDYVSFTAEELDIVMSAIDKAVAWSHSARGKVEAAKFSNDQEALLTDPEVLARLHNSVTEK